MHIYILSLSLSLSHSLTHTQTLACMLKGTSYILIVANVYIKLYISLLALMYKLQHVYC